jgi:hypothetical protein
MVQIPEFKAKTQITSQTGTRARPVADIGAAAAAPFEAAARLAGDVQKISSKFYEAQTSLQRKTETSKLIDQYLKGSENTPGLNELSFDAQNNPDTNTALPGFQKGSESLIASLATTAKDPVVKQLFTSKANEIYNNEYLNVQSSVWKNIREDGVKTLNNNIEFETNKILNAGGNKAQEFASRINIEKLIEDSARDGIPMPNGYFETVMKTVEERKAEKLVVDNPSVFLENYKNGYYDKSIEPKTLNILSNKAQSAIETGIKTLKAQVKSDISQLKSDTNDFLEVTKNPNLFGSLTDLQDLYSRGDVLIEYSKQFGLEDEVTPLLEKINSAAENFQNITLMRNSPLPVVQEELTRVTRENTEAAMSGKGVTIAESDYQSNLEKLVGKMETMINKDILNMAEDFGIAAVPDINFLESDFDTFKQEADNYRAIVTQISNRYDRSEIQYFKPEAIDNIKNYTKTADFDGMTTLIRNITYISGDDAAIAFGELAKSVPMFSQAGLMMMMNDGRHTEVTKNMLDGWLKVRDNDQNKKIVESFKLSNLEVIDGFFTVTNNLLPPSLDEVLPQTKNQIFESAKYIFYNKVLESPTLIAVAQEDDPYSDEAIDAWDLSIQEAAGLVQYGDGYFGGIAEFGDDNHIILPQEMRNGTVDKSFTDLKTFLEDTLDQELFDLATATYETPNMTEEGIQFKEPGQEFLPKINRPFYEGKEFLAKDLFENKDKIYLKNTEEYGKYHIYFNNPNGDIYDIYKDKDGKEIVFDLSAILPRLKESYKQK